MSVMAGTEGRRTVSVLFTVDVPEGITNEQVAEEFTQMWVAARELVGWWVSNPQVREVAYLAPPPVDLALVASATDATYRRGPVEVPLRAE